MTDQSPTPDKTRRKNAAELSDGEILEIRNSLRGLQYGSVQIVVQDGVLIQIERTERHRLRSSRASQ